MSLGAWAKANGRSYFEIADNASQFTQVPVLLIILGIFVALVGIVGAVGALFSGTIFGRIVLGLYGLILTLLVICEIGGGIAAGVLRNDLDTAFRESLNTTLMHYNGSDTSIKDSWDTFQRNSMCCGVDMPSDYVHVFYNNTVPASCCNKNIVGDRCDLIRQNSTGRIDEIYQNGCAKIVSDGVKQNLGAIAGGVIVLGLIQIVGIVMSCFVAIAKTKENKYEVV